MKRLPNRTTHPRLYAREYQRLKKDAEPWLVLLACFVGAPVAGLLAWGMIGLLLGIGR